MVAEAAMIPARLSRPDEDILDEIWEAFWADIQIRLLERPNLAVDVAGGVVTLRGHVANSLLADAVAGLAAGVPGVREVVNQLVADTDLEAAVGSALAAEPAARALGLMVAAFHGWVNITGEAPSAEVRAAVQRVAAGVPGVRGVLGLPRVAGQAAEAVRRAIQPHVGARVYAVDGAAGRVQFVVIDPRNRCVDAVGVRGRFEVDGRPVSGEFLLPIASVQSASASEAMLSETLADVAGRPLSPDDAPAPAPPGWAPPFPYAPEHVRWPAL